jgi:nicotinic acid mononucleotide adenylyltransferase
MGAVNDRDYVAALLAGEIDAVCCEPDGRLTADAPRPRILLPGSFNPLHSVHERLLFLAAEQVAGSAAFELSATNVDKPALTETETRRRLHQFGWRHTTWVTRAPTFVEKANLFPAVTFVIGADTAERLVARRYYGDSEMQMLAALGQIKERGCGFLVFGRRDRDQRYLALGNISVPACHRDLFKEIPREVLDHPLSSTELRKSAIGRRGLPDDQAKGTF